MKEESEKKKRTGPDKRGLCCIGCEAALGAVPFAGSLLVR